MPLLAGKTDQRKTTPYLLLSHVQDLSRSPEIRQDPPTVTRVASVDQQPKHHGVPHASGPGHEQEGTWEQWQPDRWTPWCSPLDSAILACGGVSPAQNAVFYWEKLITRHGPASAFFFFFFVCVFSVRVCISMPIAPRKKGYSPCEQTGLGHHVETARWAPTSYKGIWVQLTLRDFFVVDDGICWYGRQHRCFACLVPCLSREGRQKILAVSCLRADLLAYL